MKNSIFLFLILFIAQTATAEEAKRSSEKAIPVSNRQSSADVLDQQNLVLGMDSTQARELSLSDRKISKPILDYDDKNTLESITFEQEGGRVKFVLNTDPRTNARAKIEYFALLDSSGGKVRYGVTVYVSGPALEAMLEAANSDGFDAAALNSALSELDQNHHVAMENFIQETEAYYSEMRKRTRLKSREEIDDLLKQLLSRRRAQISQTDDSLLSTHRIYQKSVLVPSKSKLRDNMTKNIRKFNTYLDGLLKPGAFVARNDKAVEIVINLH